MPLSLFPARVPIARVSVNGQAYDVLMTPEFSRALADLFTQVGGDDGSNTPDLEVLSMFSDVGMVGAGQVIQIDAFSDGSQVLAAVSALRDEVQSLRQELASVQNYAGLAQQIEDLAKTVAMIEDPGAQVRYMQQAAGAFENFDSTNSKIVPGTATGSRAGNAALASLLSALANSGLVINSTTP